MTKAREMLEIADAYEAGLQKMIACGYEEYGPEPQRKHRLIIEALRLAAQADAPAIQPQRMPLDPCPYDHDGPECLLETYAVGPCLCALTRPKLCPTEKIEGGQS